MKREIKFRGKRIDNGEWIYGDIIQGNEYVAMIETVSLTYGGKGHFVWIKIDPNTLGQFTGLLDKNGKEIYEGDKGFTEIQGNSEVKYGRYDFAPDSECYVQLHVGFYLECTHENGQTFIVPIGDFIDEFEIIGTIHDENFNPTQS